MSEIVRIKKRALYLSLGARALKVRSKSVIVLAVRNKDLGTSFVGFTATKKIGKAVVRNKAKRRLKSLVSLYKAKILDSDMSFIFIATKQTAIINFEELESDFLYVIKSGASKCAC